MTTEKRKPLGRVRSARLLGQLLFEALDRAESRNEDFERLHHEWAGASQSARSMYNDAARSFLRAVRCRRPNAGGEAHGNR